MTHPRDHLITYVLGELPEAEKTALEAHLMNCRVCRNKVLELQAGMEGMVDSLPAVQAPDVWQQVQQNLQQHSGLQKPAEVQKKNIPWWSRPPVWAAAVVAVVALGFGSSQLIQQYQSTALVRDFPEDHHPHHHHCHQRRP